MIIPYNEIKELSKNCYVDYGDEICVCHSAEDGEREFALMLIAKCLGLLGRESINDKFIVQYLQSLISLTNPENNHYKWFLDNFIRDTEKCQKALNGEQLTEYDKPILKELMLSNIGEYTMKGEYQSCCYSAMYAFFLTAYCILRKKPNFCVSHIDMIADLDDELESIQVFESEQPTEAIIVDWHSTNKINSIYMLYKNQYSGLAKETVLDLVAADVIEKDYYSKDERFSIAPSILVKQYCGIIEHEINNLIQLLNLPNKPSKHLMWNDMKIYVKNNNIDLEFTSFELSDVLEDLHSLRNKSAHGDVITKEEYAIISQYKNLGLFDGISSEKLKLTNGKVSPTIEELNKYMGLE